MARQPWKTKHAGLSPVEIKDWRAVEAMLASYHHACQVARKTNYEAHGYDFIRTGPILSRDIRIFLNK